MISASAEFHRAIARGQPQRAILKFANGAYFTNEDISITAGGIRYEEVLNGETELTIGACPSSRLSAYLIPKPMLTTFPWGEFEALLGVRTKRTRFQTDADVAIKDSAGVIISGYIEAPYLRVNGEACTHQPSFPVHSLILYEGTLYCVDEDGNCESGVWNGISPGEFTTMVFPKYTQTKLVEIARTQRGLVTEGLTVTEYGNGACCIWEYSPLGVFIASRPEVLQTSVVEMEASDLMCRFDVMMPDMEDSAFPMSIGELLIRLCEMIGIRCVTSEFINRDVMIPTKPGSFSDATAREVLGWIAQAACSYARFDRNGCLELVWFQDSGLVMDESTFSEFVPCAYAVQPITKLVSRNTNSIAESTIGIEGNAYLIQDNPLLRVDDSAAVLLVDDTPSPTALIYERLSNFPAFSPSSMESFYDWTLQTGDVVNVVSNGQAYRMPIYNLTLEWKGAGKLSLDNSGSEYQPPISKQERVNFGVGRGAYLQKKETDAVLTWAELQINDQAGLITIVTGRLDQVENDFSAALFRIDGVEAKIEAKVNKNGVIAAINVSAEEGVLIQASKIDLDGYVTMSKFEALQGEVDRISGGTGVIETMQVSTLLAEVIQGVSSISGNYGWFTNFNVNSGGTLKIYGKTARWKTIYYADEDGIAYDATVLVAT